MLVGQNIGPFAIDKEIGGGAMGTVYLATYTKNGLKVAVKIIGPGLAGNPTTLARFERETAILKKLKHANIVRLYASGRYHGTPFYAMEYVEGESLDKILQRRGRLTWEEVATLGKQVCGALQIAHEQGIVHRDLKPANLMLTPDGTVKLTDFGIAKGLDVNQLTATNCAIGTAAYMSPEQCRGERNLTAKSDIYSLGVLFYELLTGRMPFPAETTLDMFLAHVQGSFDRPARLVLDIPVWLDTLVCQMMEKEPDKRPLDAAMVAQSLDRVLEKVAAQRSAGVDMVSSRAVDRKTLKPDETDLEAARILKAAVARKRIKRRSKPLYERWWVQAAGILLLLGGVAGLIWWAVQPPSALRLFKRAEKLMASTDTDDRVKAREGPIKDFLKHYADHQDAQATQMRQWADDVDESVRERQLRNRMKMKMGPDGEAERTAQDAVRREEGGNLDMAKQRWYSLERYKDNGDPDLHAWGLLAVKRLRELKAAEALEAQLGGSVNEAVEGGKDFKPDSVAERLGGLATRYELFGDRAAALKVWQEVKDRSESEDSRRSWKLLAARKVRQLTARAHHGPAADQARVDLIKQKLEYARTIAASNADQARVVCNEIVVLYGERDDDELSALVASARAMLMRLPAGSKKQ